MIGFKSINLELIASAVNNIYFEHQGYLRVQTQYRASNCLFPNKQDWLASKEGVINVNGLLVITITPLYNGHII